jgi:hypothetical protein
MGKPTTMADSDRIDLEDRAQLRYWAEQFGVSEQELREAVKVCGPRLRDVRERLAANRSY